MNRLLPLLLTLAVLAPVALAQPDTSVRTRTRTGEARTPVGSRAQNDTNQVDVLLEVPNLSVEQITLDVERLEAHLALHARVANLVQLDAGADVNIEGVHLEISGVQAEAYLRVDLDNVAFIVDRTLTTLENNPEIIETLGNVLTETVGTVGDVANTALGPGGAVNNLTRPDGLLSQTVNTLGQTVNRTLDATGGIVETTLGAGGQVLSRNVVGNVRDLTDVVSETAGAAGATVRRVRDTAGNVIEFTLDRAGAVTNARIVEQARSGRPSGGR